MADYKISNGIIEIGIKEKGAEMYSLTKNGKEYLWEGDAAYWGRTSPVLFPFVGSLKNKKYRYEGQEYTMGQHGFARDMDFQLKEQSADNIRFALKDTDESRKIYPFCFRLEIAYRLERSSVIVIWQIRNKDEKILHYSIGAHPAFNCPLDCQEQQRDYRLLFLDGEGEPVENIRKNPIGEGGVVTNQYTDIAVPNGLLTATEDVFAEDALVIENHQVQAVGLINPEMKEYLRVEFDAPLVGVWTPPHKNAPFICIEPWYGRCDSFDFTGDLQDRTWGNSLQPGGEAEYRYRIIINE